MGRVLSQVEQTCAHFPATACLRVHHDELQAVEAVGDVHHLPPERGGARVGHGYCDQEDQVCFFAVLFMLNDED